MATRIRAALERHQLEVYVATYQLVKGESMAQRAARLRNSWSRNPFAIVIVYDETLGQMSFVGSRDLELFVDQGQLSGAFQRAATTARHYLKARNEAREKPDPAVMISRTVDSLLTDPVLIERMTLPEPWEFTKPMMVLLGLFVLCVVTCGAFVVWFERRQGRSRELGQRTDHFPTTHMPLRLGAPFSGGLGASLGE